MTTIGDRPAGTPILGMGDPWCGEGGSRPAEEGATGGEGGRPRASFP